MRSCSTLILPLTVLAVAIAGAALFSNFNALPPLEDVPAHPCDSAQAAAAVDKLRQLLTYRTVSSTDAAGSVEHEEEFQSAWGFIEKAFPLVWARLTVEKLGGGGRSRLFTWPGKEPSLPPLLLVAHMDVVPAGDEASWTHPPFAGQEAQGYIWGRGSIDMKQVLVGILEAIQQLLGTGSDFTPSRDILFAVGQDEEVGGQLGAAEIAKVIASRYTNVDFIVDEGGALLTAGLPPLTRDPVQVLCTAEKGNVNLDVNISTIGGHSSMPPGHQNTALQMAARFISLLGSRPMPARLQPPFTDTIQELLPASPPLLRLLLKRCQTWPISALLAYILRCQGMGPGANVFTTITVTRIAAGVADNALPEHVFMRLNVRPLDGDTLDDVLTHIRKVLKDVGVADTEVNIQTRGFSFKPSNITSVQGQHYQLVKRAVQETRRLGGKAVKVAAALLPGGTDSRHYQHLTLHGTVRVTPKIMNDTNSDFQRVHGVDECIAREDFLTSICTYKRIIQLLAE